MNQHQKALQFAALHIRDSAFVIPNPWDVGSARLFEGLGFEALATTSSGFAQTLGRLDGLVSMQETLAHCAEICAATTIPVNADLENGFADSPEAVAAVTSAKASVRSSIVGPVARADPQHTVAMSSSGVRAFIFRSAC